MGGALGWWLAPLPFTLEFGVRFPVSAVWKKQKCMFLPHALVKHSIADSLRDREVACSASDLQGLNFESCVWRAVSSHSSQHPQEVLQAQFTLACKCTKVALRLIHFIFIWYIVPWQPGCHVCNFFDRHIRHSGPRWSIFMAMFTHKSEEWMYTFIHCTALNTKTI